VCGPENPAGLHLCFFRRNETTVGAHLEPPAEWHGWENLMHGGFQSLLLDEITAWAVAALTGRMHYLTIRLDVKYRKPVRLNQTLTLVGGLTETSDRSSKAWGEIRNTDEMVLAEASSTILHLPPDKFDQIIAEAP
jgi:acyl-coenzyme A thioesterase PaaI-like protein